MTVFHKQCLTWKLIPRVVDLQCYYILGLREERLACDSSAWNYQIQFSSVCPVSATSGQQPERSTSRDFPSTTMSGDHRHCQAQPKPEKCFRAACQHGTCVNETQFVPGLGDLSVEKCICNEGWVGYYCDQCCRCGPEETCRYNVRGETSFCDPKTPTVLDVTSQSR